LKIKAFNSLLDWLKYQILLNNLDNLSMNYVKNKELIKYNLKNNQKKYKEHKLNVIYYKTNPHLKQAYHK